jgi:hypothetical protein
MTEALNTKEWSDPIRWRNLCAYETQMNGLSFHNEADARKLRAKYDVLVAEGKARRIETSPREVYYQFKRSLVEDIGPT